MVEGAEEEHFDAVVVGSGFGGSVTAYRLAESGLDVCLLERGRPYPPGSFPDTPNEMARNFWDPSEGYYGLYDLWSFKGIEALVSSGLGGGSLIYANVLLRKDERWFVTEDLEQGGYESWPVTRAELDPHYDHVEAMIKPQRYPLGHPPYDTTAKTRVFAAAAESVGRKAELPPLAVTFANEGRPPVPGERIEEQPNLHGAPRYTCRLVGECDIGCNVGAKNTLDFNYLSAAKRAGAELLTGAEVTAFEPLDGGGFRISYLTHPGREQHTVGAKRLVLSAGTLGSTFLLLKNRSALPGLSPRLGSRFCGNGDLLTFAVNTSEVTDPARGPVITSAIRYPDDLDGEGDSGRGFYIEDAGVPGFVPWLVQSSEAAGSLRRAAKVAWLILRQRLVGDPESNLSAEAAGILGDGKLSGSFLPLLGMGRDIPDGTMKLTKRDYLDIDWRTRKSGPYFDRVRAESRRLAEAMGAEKLVDNPLWLLRRVITVHPLGGCPMGRTPEEGVVDPQGRAFGCEGLHVADGSVMPGPVGPNPSLTIAALAARLHTPGRESGTALMFHLTITADDTDRFIADREHEAVAEGWVESGALGGRLPVERGIFNLFVDQEGDRSRKRMLYRLHFSDGAGDPLTLAGHKVIEDDPGFDLWRDTTTLFTQILRGHVEEGAREEPEVVAAGIIHIHVADFARQLTTFRCDPPTRLDALGRFGALFAGDLWAVYGPGGREGGG